MHVCVYGIVCVATTLPYLDTCHKKDCSADKGTPTQYEITDTRHVMHQNRHFYCALWLPIVTVLHIAMVNFMISHLLLPPRILKYDVNSALFGYFSALWSIYYQHSPRQFSVQDIKIIHVYRYVNWWRTLGFFKGSHVVLSSLPFPPKNNNKQNNKTCSKLATPLVSSHRLAVTIDIAREREGGRERERSISPPNSPSV